MKTYKEHNEVTYHLTLIIQNSCINPLTFLTSIFTFHHVISNVKNVSWFSVTSVCRCEENMTYSQMLSTFLKIETDQGEPKQPECYDKCF